MEEDTKERVCVHSLLGEGFLVSPDFFSFGPVECDDIKDSLKGRHALLVLNKDMMEFLRSNQKDNLNWQDFDRSRLLFEKKKDNRLYMNFLQYLNEKKLDIEEKQVMNIEISDPEPIYQNAYHDIATKLEVQDFVSTLSLRYKAIEAMLMGRRDISNCLSISRIVGKKDREEVSFIGMIKDKEITNKNKHLKLTLEDPSGTISVLINKNNPELYSIGKDTVLDEVVAIKGSTGDKIVFANTILFPDVPYREMKKYNEDCCAVVLSDMHVGSINFLDKELEKAISWIKGEIGSESQRELASKIRYVFVLGDLVDGIGVYPDQNKELNIKDIYDQYSACAEYLKEIPKHIKIIIIPGNHDAVRIEEPQPPLYKDVAAPIFQLPNATMLSNPAFVTLFASKDFPGLDFLLYHGYSFNYYADAVDSIRQKGGLDRADLLMQFLLERRHLAPSHTSTIYYPDPKKDNLVIDKIPDFFLTGHLHKTVVSNYKNITLISGSCWQSKTSFMEKLGINPEPARVPVINFQTREVKIMRFGK
jgi:DNA polymerase II small subunit